MKKDLKKTSNHCKTLPFYFFFSKMTTAYQTFGRKLFNYRSEKENEKRLITTCMSKIGSVETIEINLNFDQKDWPDFVDKCSYLEDLFLQMIGILFRLLILNQQIYANGNLIL